MVSEGEDGDETGSQAQGDDAVDHDVAPSPPLEVGVDGQGSEEVELEGQGHDPELFEALDVPGKEVIEGRFTVMSKGCEEIK